jgi:hypothetical protein
VSQRKSSTAKSGSELPDDCQPFKKIKSAGQGGIVHERSVRFRFTHRSRKFADVAIHSPTMFANEFGLAKTDASGAIRFRARNCAGTALSRHRIGLLDE